MVDKDRHAKRNTSTWTCSVGTNLPFTPNIRWLQGRQIKWFWCGFLQSVFLPPPPPPPHGFSIVFLFFSLSFMHCLHIHVLLFFTLLFPKAFTALHPSSSYYSYADLQCLSFSMTLLTFTGQKSAFSCQVMQPSSPPLLNDSRLLFPWGLN